MTLSYYHAIIPSPVGDLTLVAGDIFLLAVLWPNDVDGRVKIPLGENNPGHPVLSKAWSQLEEYFKGTRKVFDIPLMMVGTDFQKKVWGELLKIPYGQTRSYLDVANAMGDARAVRAVGAANGKNPISIIVPCHRVVGSNGNLTGFAGGISAKSMLLRLEGQQADLF